MREDSTMIYRSGSFKHKELSKLSKSYLWTYTTQHVLVSSLDKDTESKPFQFTKETKRGEITYPIDSKIKIHIDFDRSKKLCLTKVILFARKLILGK